MTRRTALLLAMSLLGLSACGLGAQASEPITAETRTVTETSVLLPDAEWRAQLTSQEYSVLRESGTERSGSGDLLHNHDDASTSAPAAACPSLTARPSLSPGRAGRAFTSPSPMAG